MYNILGGNIIRFLGQAILVGVLDNGDVPVFLLVKLNKASTFSYC